ncbi:restriction endonuclease subunit S, partial [Thiolapillus sp.]|uniref:restriction endonuclease subunit S n=12 Tax=Thiolapillus sp. TaxID=2017437 RepID=UPI003AF8A87A
MRSKSDKKKPLVPSLRFPEFREAGAWEVKRLGGIGSVSMCKRILKSQTSESGDIPFYKIGTFSKQADAFIENKIYEEFKEKYSFPNKGDILISASGTIGRTVVYDGKPAYFQDSNIVWIANNENILLNAFLYYCYKTIQWQTDDNTISRLYNDNLRKMKIVVPPIPEQQKIAHCLSSLDEVIGLQAKKVQALKQHKKGLMQQLFPAEGETTPHLRFPEFREAGAWEVQTIDQLASKIAQGGTPKTSIPKYWNGDIPWITPAEMGEDAAHHYAETTHRTISREGFENSSTELLPVNSVIISSRAPIGYVTINKIEMATNQGCKGIVPKKNTYHEFFYFSLIVAKQRLNDLGAGAGFKEISTSTLKAFQISIPKHIEQQKIAHCLSSLDEVIGLESHKLDALKN